MGRNISTGTAGAGSGVGTLVVVANTIGSVANDDIILDPSGTGKVSIPGTDVATTTSSGALVLGGGLGVAGNIVLGGSLSTAGSQNLVLDPLGSGVVTVPGNDTSSSTSTGALVVTGGTGIGGNLWVGGNIEGAGTINGGTF